MAANLPQARIGREEYSLDSFKIVSSYFSNVVPFTVVNRVSGAVLVALNIYYNRWGNEIHLWIPQFGIPDTGVASPLDIIVNLPFPVQNNPTASTHIGFAIFGVNGVDTPGGLLLETPTPTTTRINLGAGVVPLNATFSTAHYRGIYFTAA